MEQIIIGSDHAGFQLKTAIKNFLSSLNYEIIDAGCYSEESVHYPLIAHRVASKIANAEYDLGILICGTGIGMSITANRYKNVRGALCHNTFTAQMAREHNNANLLILGARVLNPETALDILQTWLQTQFAGGRHQERIQLVDTIIKETP